MELNKFMADKLPQTESVIPDGKRNTTLSRKAGCLVKRYGNTETAKEMFLEAADRCESPLPDAELKSIWKSAIKFGEKVAKQDGYIPPDEYNDPTAHKPDDYSDVGQAAVFAKYCRDYVRYSPATDYLVYDGIC